MVEQGGSCSLKVVGILFISRIQPSAAFFTLYGARQLNRYFKAIANPKKCLTDNLGKENALKKQFRVTFCGN